MKTATEILAEVLDIHVDPLIDDAAGVEALVSEIKESMEKYADQQAIEFSKWKDYHYLEDGFGEDVNEPLYSYILDLNCGGEDMLIPRKKLFTIEELYKQFKEERQ